MKTSDLKDWAIVAALIGAAFVAWKFFNKADEYREKASGALSDKFTEWFDKRIDITSTAQVTAFPDGQLHAVPMSAVDANGFFVNKNFAPNYPGDGRRYRLAKSATPITRGSVTTYFMAVKQA